MPPQACRASSRSRADGRQLERRDLAVLDRPGGQVVVLDAVDEVRLALPEPDVLDVGARRTRRRGQMRVHDGLVELAVADVGPLQRIEEELEAVRGRRRVRRAHVLDRDVAVEQQQAAAFVRRFLLSVRSDRVADLRRDYHQRVCSIDCSTASASMSQNSALRYFQPASARTHTTTPSSSSLASLRATCTTAPADTPPKMPSSSSNARTARTASSFDTSTLRSSFDTSRIGGT